MLELLIGAYPHYFRLGWIESQPAGPHPVIDVTDTRSKTLHCHYSVADCHMKVKFAVISILVWKGDWGAVV